MGELVFNANEVEPAGMSQSLPVSPADGFPMMITASEIKGNAAGTGGFLELMVAIMDGEHKGQTGIYRLNIYSANAQACEIAFRQLSAVCHVTGQMNIATHEQLHNIPFRGVVGYQKRKADWKEGDPEYTEVKGVLHSDGAQPGKSTATPSTPSTPSTPTPPDAGGAEAANPSWKAPNAGADTKAADTPAWAQPK